MLWGRECELAAMEQVLAAARSGQGRCLVLLGEPEMGKSALLAEAAERARDMRVLSAVGAETEAAFPYAALHQLLRPGLDGLHRLPAPQAAALRVALGLGPGLAADPFLVALAVLTLLCEIGRERPLLCLLDDAQWVDPPSLNAIRFVARRLGSDPIALIVALRGEAATTDTGVEAMTIGGLEPSAVATVLDHRCGPGLAWTVRDALIIVAAGNPLAWSSCLLR
jgi:hypothetical protein